MYLKVFDDTAWKWQFFSTIQQRCSSQIVLHHKLRQIANCLTWRCNLNQCQSLYIIITNMITLIISPNARFASWYIVLISSNLSPRPKEYAYTQNNIRYTVCESVDYLKLQISILSTGYRVFVNVGITALHCHSTFEWCIQLTCLFPKSVILWYIVQINAYK